MENAPASEQYEKHTTEFSKAVAKAFNSTARAVDDETQVQIAPIQIEYLLNSWSGGLYRRVMNTPKVIKERLIDKKQITSPRDIPLFGTLFVRDPYAPRKQIEQFYSKVAILDEKFDGRESNPLTAEEQGQRKLFNKVQYNLRPLWRQLREEDLTEAERKEVYKKVQYHIEQTGITVESTEPPKGSIRERLKNLLSKKSLSVTEQRRRRIYAKADAKIKILEKPLARTNISEATREKLNFKIEEITKEVDDIVASVEVIDALERA